MGAGGVAGALGAPVPHTWARGRGGPATRPGGAAAPGDDGGRDVTERDGAKGEGERARDGLGGGLGERVDRLGLENDVPGAVARVSEAGSPGSPANGEKTPAVDGPRATTGGSPGEPAASSGTSRSPCEYQRRAMARTDRRERLERLRERVREVLGGANRSRGHRHAARELRSGADPVVVPGRVVRRVMREEGLVVAYARRRARHGPYLGEISRAPDDLVARRFRAERPNELWPADVTEFALPDGKACLSAVPGCFDGGLASWSIGRRPDAELANGSPGAARRALSPGQRPTVHSDRGCRCRWPGWVAICEENRLVRSMSRKGCSPDNAAMEGFFGRPRNEFFRHRGWSGVTAPEFCAMLDAYLRYHDEGGPKERLGWRSPMRYREGLGLAA